MPATEYTAGLIATALAHGAAYQGPATVYLALVITMPTKTVAGTEITLGSYARVTFSQDDDWTDDGDGNLTNTADISYPQATANYDAAVVAVEAYDEAGASPPENRLWWAELSTPLTVVNGQTPKIPAGDLDVSLV